MKPSLERESQVYVHHETLRKEILRQSGMRKNSRFFWLIKSICFCRRCCRCQSSPHFSRGKLWCSSGKLKLFFLFQGSVFSGPHSHMFRPTNTLLCIVILQEPGTKQTNIKSHLSKYRKQIFSCDSTV